MNRRKKRPVQETGSPRPVKVLAMLIMPLLVVAIAACDNGGTASRTRYQDSPEGKPPGLSAPIPDPKEVTETKPSGQMPDFLSSVTGPAHDRLVAMYTGAVNHYDAYSHIPCYCGCAIYTTSHMSLAQCYVKSMNSDGSVVFTDHSTSCDICQGVAQKTLDGIAASTPLKDVRADIFKSFKYTGIWTDTPPIP